MPILKNFLQNVGVAKKPAVEIAEERIEAARESKATSLNLFGLGLTELPPSLWQLTGLKTLRVDCNQLTELPDALGSLTQLERLEADDNQLAVLPEALGSLTQLRELLVHKNQLKALPRSLGRLTQLRELLVHNNQLKALPESMLRLTELQKLELQGNTALGLPPEVLSPDGRPANPPSILDYYFKTRGRKAESRPLNEAKMILVGRGGVGKTCLVHRLVHDTYNPDERKTDGIAITSWPVRVGQDDVRLNIWDFGGQEIMHATHQFFLTKRSLYVLVLNAREGEQDANVEYWLRLVESFGSDSPVLVAINKFADHPFDLNRRGLQAKFPAIRGFVRTDCETELGLEELREAILRETDRLEHLRDPFPASWFNVKETLANLPKNEGTNFIPFTRYLELCDAQGVTEATSQETLVGFLHDLGIVVNFRDNPRLSETQVLDPEWVTNGIYKILNADWLAKKEGELRLEDLPGVLDRKEYPKEMHLYLLDLMRKFELCYEFYDGDGHYLVPELLGKEEPDLKEFASGGRAAVRVSLQHPAGGFAAAVHRAVAGVEQEPAPLAHRRGAGVGRQSRRGEGGRAGPAGERRHHRAAGRAAAVARGHPRRLGAHPPEHREAASDGAGAGARAGGTVDCLQEAAGIRGERNQGVRRGT